jgi:hypothetical protein
MKVEIELKKYETSKIKGESVFVNGFITYLRTSHDWGLESWGSYFKLIGATLLEITEEEIEKAKEDNPTHRYNNNKQYAKMELNGTIYIAMSSNALCDTSGVSIYFDHANQVFKDLAIYRIDDLANFLGVYKGKHYSGHLGLI